MKEFYFNSVLLILGLATLALSSCKDNDFKEGTITTPEVATDFVDDVSSNSAKVYGGILSVGGERVMGAARILVSGFTYGTKTDPTIENNKTTGGPTHGDFSEVLRDLKPSTTYYVRAYATNAAGTAYGETLSFTTEDGVEVPDTPTEPDISGGTFEDRFEDDALSENWKVIEGSAEIENGAVRMNNGLMAFGAPGADLSGGGANEYSFSVDIHNIPGENRFAGVAFNIQEGGAGFYFIRIQQYHGSDGPGATLMQVLKAGPGGENDLLTDDFFRSDLITDEGVYNENFRVTISSTSPGSFHLKIVSLPNEEVIEEIDLTDQGVPYQGGSAGLWSGDFSGDGDTYFDNFILTVAGSDPGSEFTDNFNRSEIGEDWSYDKNDFQIENDRVVSTGNTVFMIYDKKAPEVVVNDDHSFSFEVDMDIEPSSNGYGGVVFNYKQNEGFYLIRTQEYHGSNAAQEGSTRMHLLKYGFKADGSPDLKLPDEANPGVFADAFLTDENVYVGKYRIRVSRPDAVTINIAFLDSDTKEVLKELSFEDEGTPLTNGFVGFYSGNAGGDGKVYFDNFMLSIQ